MKIQRSLGIFGLVFILYFTTSGGPFTTETLLQKVRAVLDGERPGSAL